MVAYLSDMYLVGSTVYPHVSHGNLYKSIASLDNTIWFHNYEFRADDWLLYEVQSPAADSGRAIASGRIWTASGRLIATTAQEVLARFHGQSSL
jgi:acyl-CoA thioesterase II